MARTLNLEQLTLRDKIREAARRTHDMIEHVEQAFVPKAHELRKVSRPQDRASETPPISDVTIRHHSAMVLESDQYTEGLNEEAESLFEAIAAEVNKLASRGQPH
jgi:hypothetical protein